jgi:serine/threonine-protein kinase
MELRHWVDSAEARALRNEARGTPVATPPGRRLLRLGLPLLAFVAVAGGLAWLKFGTSPAETAAAPPPASAPTRVAAATPPVVLAPAAAAAEEAAAKASAASAAAKAGSAPALALATDAGMAPEASAPAAAAAPSVPVVVSKAEAARRRKAMAVATITEGVPISAVLSEGVVQLALSPWGQVEVDGKPMGTSPPLTRLTLSSGNHTITVRNSDFPAYTTTVTVDGESPVTLRHRFGP